MSTQSLPLQNRAKVELELRRRRSSRSKSTGLPPLHVRYKSDPVAFVHDCFDWPDDRKPAAYQDEILANIVQHRRVSARGPHGLGKTAIVAWATLWFALTNDSEGVDWKIPITASAWRQLTKFALPEIHKWVRKLRWNVVGRPPFSNRYELQSLSLKLTYGEAFALSSDNPSMIEGAHASRMLYIFDESKVIPVPTWDSAEGAFSAGDCYWLSVSTPGEPVGRFYDIQSRKPGYDDWKVRAVTLGEAIEAGRINETWAAARKLQWGESSAVYQNRVLGEFASSEEDGVIPLSWVEASNVRWEEWNDHKEELNLSFTQMGVDVARSGTNKTVLAPRFEKVVTELRKFSHADTMETAGRVAGVLSLYNGPAVIDVIGVGAGVYDRLNEQQYNVIPFNAAERTDAKDRSGELGFINCRSAGWWSLRELLDPANGENIALPPDDNLTGDLVSPHWKVVSGGKIQIESKDDIAKRIGRSTDDGDAVVMSFWQSGSISMKDWIAALRKTNEEREEKKKHGIFRQS